MPIRHQPGFFDIHQRTAKLTEMGDPLVGLKDQIDWEAFRPGLNVVYEKPRKSNAGAKPIDVVLMFKILVLQQLYNLSDDRIEYQIRDRFSFMRFLGLQLEDRVPDAKTIWLFRERLKELNLVDKVFAKFHEQLETQGYVAKAGQMIDATFVEAPRQRNSREENATIKSGKIPQEWEHNPNKLRQKDTDARWAKKNDEHHYGYKNHINADQTNKLVQSFALSNAAVHDSQVFEELLDHTTDADGKKRRIYADSAYRSKDQEESLSDNGFESKIHENGTRCHPLTDEQKASNRIKSKTRARVEHVFGAQHAMGGHIVRTIGFGRAKVKIGMMNLVYNMKRMIQLIKRDAKAASLGFGYIRRGASAVA
jgi:IS5 family transposase